MGEGFVLSDEEKRQIESNDNSTHEIIFPYFNGNDLLEMPIIEARRWIIDFNDRDENSAKKWMTAFNRVKSLVKPFRDSQKGQIHQHCFWKFWDMRPTLRKNRTINNRFLGVAIVAKYLVFRFVNPNNVFNHKVKLLFLERYSHFSILQSSIHVVWAYWRSGLLGASVFNYSTSKSLDSFPFPEKYEDALNDPGEKFYLLREKSMKSNNMGPTELYNELNNPESSIQIDNIRQSIIAMDYAVLTSYGWQDINLSHGFHAVPYLQKKDRIRFTISEPARIEILHRLSKLNLQRYEEEVRQGLHVKSGGSQATAKRGGKRDKDKSISSVQGSLDFSEPDNLKSNYGKDFGNQVLTFLVNHQGWHGKETILTGSALPTNRWLTTIRKLMDDNLVEKRCEQRGSEYRAFERSNTP
jgi:hypothetical protein